MGDTLRDLQKRFAGRALAIALVAAFVLVVAGFKPAGKGLVLGALFSVLNFVLIAELIGRRGPGFGWRLGGVALRMALMAVPLVVAIRQPQFGFWGVVAGLFAVPAMILLAQGTGSGKSASRRIQEG
jgi:hypothetical protein